MMTDETEIETETTMTDENEIETGTTFQGSDDHGEDKKPQEKSSLWSSLTTVVRSRDCMEWIVGVLAFFFFHYKLPDILYSTFGLNQIQIHREWFSTRYDIHYGEDYQCVKEPLPQQLLDEDNTPKTFEMVMYRAWNRAFPNGWNLNNTDVQTEVMYWLRISSFIFAGLGSVLKKSWMIALWALSMIAYLIIGKVREESCWMYKPDVQANVMYWIGVSGGIFLVLGQALKKRRMIALGCLTTVVVAILEIIFGESPLIESACRAVFFVFLAYKCWPCGGCPKCQPKPDGLALASSYGNANEDHSVGTENDNWIHVGKQENILEK